MGDRVYDAGDQHQRLSYWSALHDSPEEEQEQPEAHDTVAEQHRGKRGVDLARAQSRLAKSREVSFARTDHHILRVAPQPVVTALLRKRHVRVSILDGTLLDGRESVIDR